MLTFTENIEKVIIDNFQNADKSIVIVVAWFTNPKIIDALVNIKRSKSISIDILVDDNHINHKYFFQKFSKYLDDEGINVKKQNIKAFIHHKYSVIDNCKIIIGSYNYTKKANYNKENIAIHEDMGIASYFTRLFQFMTIENYMDENINLLKENFEFANKLISTYYPFKRRVLDQIKNKIEIGECYTYPNGLYDEIYYEPGLIFNKKFYHFRELKNQKRYKNSFELIDSKFSQEFDLPIEKDMIIKFKSNEINNFNLSSLTETAHFDKIDIDYDSLMEDAKENERVIEKFYKRKFERILSKSELRNLIENNVDIIFENYLWFTNFQPFLNDKIILEIYNSNNISSQID